MRKAALPTLLVSSIAAAALMTSSQVFAYGAGDFFTRVGVAKVDPTSNNGEILGADVNVDAETNFAFTLGYRFHDKMGVELLAALPFKHDLQVEGVTDGSTKHLPPTLTLQYYPLGGTEARVQPYVGAGINYTRFSDEKTDIGASLELDDSWGAAGQVGIDLLIDEHWALNAAAWYIDIDSDAKVGGAEAGTVEIDPVVVMAGLSYRF
ncbi:OmpW/AlkL family protein [Vreelandella indica]|jgi:outer membrane protein|uniref:OmpW/AlkL family protein n=1 Tax=Vreelandella indica TaxID=3126500 RepID=UPI00300DEDBD|tara:strand:- start:31730 stop:32353 length:624 start_codon:yes stop_codon:yes gene_type:complete